MWKFSHMVKVLYTDICAMVCDNNVLILSIASQNLPDHSWHLSLDVLYMYHQEPLLQWMNAQVEGQEE